MGGNDDDKDFVFRWTLENFGLQASGRCVYSPVFYADVPNLSYWRLKLIPKGKQSGGFVSCFLECHKCTKFKRVNIDFELRAIDVGDVSTVSRRLNGVSFTPGARAGFEDFFRAVDLTRGASELLPGGHVTVECHLKQSARPPRDDDLTQLSRVFLDLFRTPEFSDFVLMTRNQHFRVHRELVCARAHKFSREHGLIRPRKASKRSVEFDRDVLRALLVYLYSGRIESIQPDVWASLYDLTERYALHDLKRDMVPSPTASYACTRIDSTAKTVVFRVANFASATSASLGRLVDLGFARVGLEYFVHDDPALDPQVGIKVRSFATDPGATDPLVCTVSVLDVESEALHFASCHEVARDDVTELRCLVPKKLLFSSQFLVGDSVRMEMSFHVSAGMEPTKIRSSKTRRAVCIGLEPPSNAALQTLSADLAKLAMGANFLNHDPTTMGKYFTKTQKAVFSAWSGVFRESFKSKCQSPLKNMTPEICEILYRYMCTGDIPGILTQTALYLYPVSRSYEMPSLQQLIVRKIKSQLDVRNAVDGLLFSLAFNDRELFFFVKDFVCMNHNEVLGEESWKHLCDVNPALAETVLENIME